MRGIAIITLVVSTFVLNVPQAHALGTAGTIAVIAASNANRNDDSRNRYTLGLLNSKHLPGDFNLCRTFEMAAGSINKYRRSLVDTPFDFRDTLQFSIDLAAAVKGLSTTASTVEKIIQAGAAIGLMTAEPFRGPAVTSLSQAAYAREVRNLCIESPGQARETLKIGFDAFNIITKKMRGKW